MSWTYWRTKGDWDGLITADNGEISWIWFPEVNRWCYPEPSHQKDLEHWQETSKLEYLMRTGDPLPELPESLEEWEKEWEQRKQ